MSAPEVDEINKIRKSLGLPLLPSATAPTEEQGPKFKDASDSDSDDEPASTLDTREAAGYDNFKKLQDEKRRVIEREKKKAAIQKARDAAARSAKLEGKGLGDLGDEDDVDAKSWLKGSKKRQLAIEKQRAQQLARELAEREEQARIQYSSKDLAGVRVAHEVGDFEDAEGEQILTLQDTEIGKGDDSDDEDVLENADLVAKDKLQEKLDLKKKRAAYDVHEEGDKGLLSQYDEKKRKAFTLDEAGTGIQERETKRQAIGDKLKNTVSLDIFKPEPVSDYLEIKMKKPKKSKKKSTRKREADEDDIFPINGNANDSMDIDVPRTAPTQRKAAESEFNDDEDLSQALAFSRRAALKKQKRKPEDIIKQLREEEQEDEGGTGGGFATPTPEEGSLTLDDTTNFLDNLNSRPRSESPKPRGRNATSEPARDSPRPAEDEDTDHPMAEVSIEDEADEAALLEAARRQQSSTQDSPHIGFGEEEDVEQGLGATLKLLRERGALDAEKAASDRNALLKERQSFIIEARLREHDNEQRARAQRERDRTSGRLTQMSAKEREEHARWQNTQREHQSSIEAARQFNEHYKPDVNLKYVDDEGRVMDRKEAFKHLSHMFHGKGSGKGKTEKKIKKREQEREQMARGVLDSSAGSGRAGVEVGKKRGEAGVRLG
ncbi:uncharacterized protein HMPREF1541_02657 [Cyphellophora europaea CBS 101466]|uniref:SART-1 protein n=1 Tax=Cyphellophora europaea (strain CBS 101466) TaxID=1220924 RepID=W2S640_CYPE1|nr:uncharacterized protein HMPREF1541_02657 [Cyphellophora europaea CBS 101466]ETN43498.1 hypothetical protein HMPREF1541_02657 [Cyphellophora europaea CBS 101466]